MSYFRSTSRQYFLALAISAAEEMTEAGCDTSVDWCRRHCMHCHPAPAGFFRAMLSAPDRRDLGKLFAQLIVVKACCRPRTQCYL